MKHLLKNTRASAAIEFGLIAPVLFFLLLGIIELGFTMFYDSSLNLGIRTAARAGIPQGFSSVDPIHNTIRDNVGGLYDRDKSKLIIRSYPNFTAMKADADAFSTNPEAFIDAAPAATALPTQSGQVMLYGVRYQWGGLLGIYPWVPKYLYSFSIVRNETFD